MAPPTPKPTTSSSGSRQRLPSPKPAPDGKLVATILSTYDLPDDATPQTVILDVLGKTAETGPPAARHKDRNSFKFVGPKTSESSGSNNELTISAPLSSLYSSTAKFTVQLPTQSLSATLSLSQTLRVNETQWLILNLLPTSSTPPNPNSPPPSDNPTPPTLRIKLYLTGPYRPEISTLINLSQTWFSAVDSLAGALRSTMHGISTELPSRLPAVKFLLLPAVPIATVAVALTPLLLGILIMGLPFLLPLVAIVLSAGVGLGAIGAGLYFSAAPGRAQLAGIVSPVTGTLLMTPAGQRVVYDTGARPSPVSLARTVLPDDMTGKLICSLLIDLIGSASYLIPVAGEAFDLSWAPIQAVLVAAMYDESMPALKYISFVEEICPFTDLIPSATMGWVKEFGEGFLEKGVKVGMEMNALAKREREGALSGGAR